MSKVRIADYTEYIWDKIPNPERHLTKVRGHGGFLTIKPQEDTPLREIIMGTIDPRIHHLVVGIVFNAALVEYPKDCHYVLSSNAWHQYNAFRPKDFVRLVSQPEEQVIPFDARLGFQTYFEWETPNNYFGRPGMDKHRRYTEDQIKIAGQCDVESGTIHFTRAELTRCDHYSTWGAQVKALGFMIAIYGP